MLTDLYLQKYLEGRLSEEEEKELEILLEKNPELKKKLEELEDRGHGVSRPMWERTRFNRRTRHGSKVRYTTILPALLILVLVLVLASHWFGKPGGNSTFIHAGGNGTSVELLYNSSSKNESGWRYIDKEFKPGDSLTFTVRDKGKYSIKVYGIYAGMPEPVAEEIWKSPAGRQFSNRDPEPIFTSNPTQNKSAPQFLAVVYDTASLDALLAEGIPGLLHNGVTGGRTQNLHYQVFRVPDGGSR